MSRLYSCFSLLQALLCVHYTKSFAIHPLGTPGIAVKPLESRSTAPHFRVLADRRQSKISFARVRNDDYDDDEDDLDERELVKVPRGGRRRGKYYNEEADNDEYDYDMPSKRQTSYFDQDDEDYYDDDDEEIDEEELEKEIADLFENVVLPNPLLDSMDPDGAADRFWPELARDPRFWFDFALFIAFLNFLSFAGPRDTLSDLPWWT